MLKFSPKNIMDADRGAKERLDEIWMARMTRVKYRNWWVWLVKNSTENNSKLKQKRFYSSDYLFAY